MNTIQRIENNERISREAFRNAERKGELAPHVFVENPANAICQECDLVIHFEIFLDSAVKRALEELEAAERILDAKHEYTIYCADCNRNVTNEPNHECKEQRAANRHAQARLIVDPDERTTFHCPECGGKLKVNETRCPHGSCEYGWPAANSEGRISE